MRTWGSPGEISKETTPTPALESVCDCTELGLGSEGRNVCVLRGSRSPTPCRVQLPPAWCVPRGLEGQSGKGLQSLCRHGSTSG